jgi:UDP-glucuronate 4-epimerase
MNILITGAAGFIGFHLVKKLSAEGHRIVGLDSLNNYYDPALKLSRLSELGIDRGDIVPGKLVKSRRLKDFRFIKMDIVERENLNKLFAEKNFTHVINLAGQAGVRYSLEDPYSYVQSNVVGFLNILEACRHNGVRHLAYASSSSVYGENSHTPFSESERTDTPASLYAATKKSDELMAYAYSKLFGIETTGMRFFTVYGPWGRPDMAPIKFMKAIINGETIQIYNHGHMWRDFTYIDDIVNGVLMIVHSENPDSIPFRIYNIGCSSPVKLMDFISEIEHAVGRKAIMEMLDMQPGDVTRTYADTSRMQHDFGYRPSTSLQEGIRKLYDWYTHR